MPHTPDERFVECNAKVAQAALLNIKTEVLRQLDRERWSLLDVEKALQAIIELETEG